MSLTVTLLPVFYCMSCISICKYLKSMLDTVCTFQRQLFWVLHWKFCLKWCEHFWWFNMICFMHFLNTFATKYTYWVTNCTWILRICTCFGALAVHNPVMCICWWMWLVNGDIQLHPPPPYLLIFLVELWSHESHCKIEYYVISFDRKGFKITRKTVMIREDHYFKA